MGETLGERMGRSHQWLAELVVHRPGIGEFVH